MRRMPQIASTADVMVTCVGVGLHKLAPARARSAEPLTSRIRSNPVPGQPPANEEYKRRNTHPGGH